MWTRFPLFNIFIVSAKQKHNMVKLYTYAFLDAATPWQIGFQDPATPIIIGIIHFHNHLIYFLVVIGTFVFWLLYRALVLFTGNSSNTVPSKFTHSTPLEIVWTITPALLFLLKDKVIILLITSRKSIKLRRSINFLGFIPFEAFEELYDSFFYLYNFSPLSIFIYFFLILVLAGFWANLSINSQKEYLLLYFGTGVWFLCFINPTTFIYFLVICWFPTLWVYLYLKESYKTKDLFGPLEVFAFKVKEPYESFTPQIFAKTFLEIRENRRLGISKAKLIVDIYGAIVLVVGLLVRYPFFVFATLVFLPKSFMVTTYFLLFGLITGTLLLTMDKKFVELLDKHLCKNFLGKVGFASNPHLILSLIGNTLLGILISQSGLWEQLKGKGDDIKLLKASPVSLKQPKLLEDSNQLEDSDQKALVLYKGNNPNMIPSPSEPFKKFYNFFKKPVDPLAGLQKANLEADLAFKIAQRQHLHSQTFYNYTQSTKNLFKLALTGTTLAGAATVSYDVHKLLKDNNSDLLKEFTLKKNSTDVDTDLSQLSNEELQKILTEEVGKNKKLKQELKDSIKKELETKNNLPAPDENTSQNSLKNFLHKYDKYLKPPTDNN